MRPGSPALECQRAPWVPKAGTLSPPCPSVSDPECRASCRASNTEGRINVHWGTSLDPFHLLKAPWLQGQSPVLDLSVWRCQETKKVSWVTCSRAVLGPRSAPPAAGRRPVPDPFRSRAYAKRAAPSGGKGWGVPCSSRARLLLSWAPGREGRPA